jgi:hypothetical protein
MFNYIKNLLSTTSENVVVVRDLSVAAAKEVAPATSTFLEIQSGNSANFDSDKLLQMTLQEVGSSIKKTSEEAWYAIMADTRKIDRQITKLLEMNNLGGQEMKMFLYFGGGAIATYHLSLWAAWVIAILSLLGFLAGLILSSLVQLGGQVAAYLLIGSLFAVSLNAIIDDIIQFVSWISDSNETKDNELIVA